MDCKNMADIGVKLICMNLKNAIIYSTLMTSNSFFMLKEMKKFIAKDPPMKVFIELPRDSPA